MLAVSLKTHKYQGDCYDNPFCKDTGICWARPRFLSYPRILFATLCDLLLNYWWVTLNCSWSTWFTCHQNAQAVRIFLSSLRTPGKVFWMKVWEQFCQGGNEISIVVFRRVISFTAGKRWSMKKMRRKSFSNLATCLDYRTMCWM